MDVSVTLAWVSFFALVFTFLGEAAVEVVFAAVLFLAEDFWADVLVGVCLAVDLPKLFLLEVVAGLVLTAFLGALFLGAAGFAFALVDGCLADFGVGITR